jgi:hypothetical protein
MDVEFDIRMTSLLESFVKLPWFFVERAMAAALNLEEDWR